MNFKNTKNISLSRLKDEMTLRYNPLNHLTPQRITRALDDFHMGYLSDASKIYDAIKRRDGVIQACVQKRKKASSRLTWTISQIGDNKDLSEIQAEFLEDFFNNLEATSINLANKKGSISLLIENILTCLENQFSVHELIWKPKANGCLSAECRYVPLWYFENTKGYLRFKKSSFDTHGEDMKNGEWLIAASESSLMEASSICYIIKRFALADWATFSGRFGGAIATVKTTAAYKSDQWINAEEMVANIAQNKGAVLSSGDDFNLIQASGTGSPFQALVNEMNKMIALIWRGSDLATLSAGNASGASLQADENEILEDADCSLVEETIANYLTLPALEWKFGKGVEVAACFTLTRKDRKDKKQQIELFERATKLGCPPAKRDIYEELSIRQPSQDEEKAELSDFAAKSENSGFTLANEKKENPSLEDEILEFAKERGKKAEPILEELEKINESSKTPEEYFDKLEQFKLKILSEK